MVKISTLSHACLEPQLCTDVEDGEGVYELTREHVFGHTVSAVPHMGIPFSFQPLFNEASLSNDHDLCGLSKQGLSVLAPLGNRCVCHPTVLLYGGEGSALPQEPRVVSELITALGYFALMLKSCSPPWGRP